MCEVCKTEGEDYLFKNGSKKFLSTSHLYKVFRDTAAPVKLCHVHGIELFLMGERRFLQAHLDFARVLAVRVKPQRDVDSPFGL
jgi:hypothetical protein